MTRWVCVLSVRHVLSVRRGVVSVRRLTLKTTRHGNTLLFGNDTASFAQPS